MSGGGFQRGRGIRPMRENDKLNAYSAFNSMSDTAIEKYDIVWYDNIVEGTTVEVSLAIGDGSEYAKNSTLAVAQHRCEPSPNVSSKQSVRLDTQAWVPFDTSAAAVMDKVWLSDAVDGKFTLTQPTADPVWVGVVLKVGTVEGGGIVHLAPNRYRGSGGVDLTTYNTLDYAGSDRVDLWGTHFKWDQGFVLAGPPHLRMRPKWRTFIDTEWESTAKFSQTAYVDPVNGDDEQYAFNGLSSASAPYKTIARALRDFPYSRTDATFTPTIRVVGAGATLDFDDHIIQDLEDCIVEFETDLTSPDTNADSVTVSAHVRNSSNFNVLTITSAATGDDVFNGFLLEDDASGDLGWVIRSTDNLDGTHDLLVQPPRDYAGSGQMATRVISLHDPATAMCNVRGQFEFRNSRNVTIKNLYHVQNAADHAITFTNCEGELDVAQFKGQRASFIDCKGLSWFNVFANNSDNTSTYGSQIYVERSTISANQVTFDGTLVSEPNPTGTAWSLQAVESLVKVGFWDFVQSPPMRGCLTRFEDLKNPGLGTAFTWMNFWDNTRWVNSETRPALIRLESVNTESRTGRVFEAGDFPYITIGVQPTVTKHYLVKAIGHSIAIPLMGEGTIDLTTVPPTGGPLSQGVGVIGDGGSTPNDISAIHGHQGGGSIRAIGNFHTENDDRRRIQNSADEATIVIDWTLGNMIELDLSGHRGDAQNVTIQMVGPRVSTPCFLHVNNNDGSSVSVNLTWGASSAEYAIVWEGGTPPATADANKDYVLMFTYIPRAGGGVAGSGKFIGRVYAGPY